MMMISLKDTLIFLQLLLVVILDETYHKQHHDQICQLIKALRSKNKKAQVEGVRQIEVFLFQNVCIREEERLKGHIYEPQQQQFIEFVYKEFRTHNTKIKRFCDIPNEHQGCNAASTLVCFVAAICSLKINRSLHQTGIPEPSDIFGKRRYRSSSD